MTEDRRQMTDDKGEKTEGGDREPGDKIVVK